MKSGKVHVAFAPQRQSFIRFVNPTLMTKEPDSLPNPSTLRVKLRGIRD